MNLFPRTFLLSTFFLLTIYIVGSSLGFSLSPQQMALVIITGLPCSGRTTRARELQANFQRRIAEASSSSAGSSTGSTSAPAQAPAASTSAFKSRANAGGNAAPAPLPKVVSIVNDADIHVDRETYACKLLMCSRALPSLGFRDKECLANFCASHCDSAQAREKPARASYLSAAMRALSQDRIVLADAGAGTYIKGFRYQLWCAARESGVRCVTVRGHEEASNPPPSTLAMIRIDNPSLLALCRYM